MDAETAPPSLLDQLGPMLPTYTHLLIAAVIPIYAAAHASLRRPPNTLTPAESRALRSATEDTASDDELEEAEASLSQVEQLSTTDAVMFPITAGVLLVSLYVLIKLVHPAYINAMLTSYFCLVGIAAVSKSLADIMNLGVRLVFPKRITSPEGRVFVVRANEPKWVCPAAPEAKPPTPHPSPLLPFLPWKLRKMLTTRYRLSIIALGRCCLVTPLTSASLLSPLIALPLVFTYFLGNKPWPLTNVLGLSFSYGAMQLLSPSTFPIATLLLGLLFFYDIYFVFYTPLMMTVATSLDVPIKLLFPRPESGLAMLGLGDIVIPGLVVTMALRWDLWRHYERLRRAMGGKMKPRYYTETRFEKAYFWASVVGYMLGMVVTLGVMHVYKHAQPALLYLVPGVLGAVWGTAVVKGEVGEMWRYSEEGEEEEEEVATDEEDTEDKSEEKKDRDDGRERVLLDVRLVVNPERKRKAGTAGKIGEKLPPVAPMSSGERERDGNGEARRVVESRKEQMWETQIIGSEG